MPTASPHAAASARNPIRRAVAALGTVGLTALAACGSVTAGSKLSALLNVAPLVIK
jgi:hypothetical protein